MKMAVAFTCVLLALVGAGCGEGETATSSDQQRGAEKAEGQRSSEGGRETANEAPREYRASGPFATVSVGRGDARPEVDPPDRPPPEKTLVRDLEIGTGPVARKGNLAIVQYVGINYKTGKKQYGYWAPERPVEVLLTFDTESKAWEETIEGMKVGGLREMVIPSRVLFGTGTIDYVLELIRVEPGLVALGSRNDPRSSFASVQLRTAPG